LSKYAHLCQGEAALFVNGVVGLHEFPSVMVSEGAASLLNFGYALVTTSEVKRSI